MENQIKRAAIKKAYQVIKDKGTSLENLFYAGDIVRFNFPSLESDSIVELALSRYTKYNSSSQVTDFFRTENILLN